MLGLRAAHLSLRLSSVGQCFHGDVFPGSDNSPEGASWEPWCVAVTPGAR